MKVLYGVQATGNGHITRARVMAPALERAGIEVDYLFSGREPEKLFNMEPFGDYRCRQGMTFYMKGSRVDYVKTLTANNPVRLIRDICALDLSGYDLVITDFEPVTAWAAKLRGVPSLGIAHQYAFLHKLPDSKTGWLLKQQISSFAPAKTALGLHWHHFDKPICPPLIQPPLFEPSQSDRKVLVYLPHDPPDQIEAALSAYPDYEFYIYSGLDQPEDKGNMHLRPFSREGFHRDLASCAGVICNSGFGLLSEAVQYGKKVLTLPQKGQVEQESNAEILELLGMGLVINKLSEHAKLADWLEMSSPEPQIYPDLASVLAQWIASGCQQPVEALVQQVWQLSPEAEAVVI
ncbi:MJ1255/VC2487 family glycosyltransferase [Neptuniibacter halophilus]|uniref:MJ1255/VC2487 family glycosyltransferase n=1 Tax=Neptuniibacter halophilus TaxID=651666 RepID=UPI002573B281|nr:MJ1255/VC2487 family glycosyltransferase [Neptuniibacter halophilus]